RPLHGLAHAHVVERLLAYVEEEIVGFEPVTDVDLVRPRRVGAQTRELGWRHLEKAAVDLAAADHGHRVGLGHAHAQLGGVEPGRLAAVSGLRTRITRRRGVNSATWKGPVATVCCERVRGYFSATSRGTGAVKLMLRMWRNVGSGAVMRM